MTRRSTTGCCCRMMTTTRRRLWWWAAAAAASLLWSPPRATIRVQWGYLKVTGVDTRRGVVSRRPKYVFCMVSGAAAPLKQKATGLLHMGAIAEVLSEAHVSFEVEGGGELSEGVVVGKLLGACGAHRAQRLRFRAGVVPTGEA